MLTYGMIISNYVSRAVILADIIIGEARTNQVIINEVEKSLVLYATRLKYLMDHDFSDSANVERIVISQ